MNTQPDRPDLSALEKAFQRLEIHLASDARKPMSPRTAALLERVHIEITKQTRRAAAAGHIS